MSFRPQTGEFLQKFISFPVSPDKKETRFRKESGTYPPAARSLERRRAGAGPAAAWEEGPQRIEWWFLKFAIEEKKKVCGVFSRVLEPGHPFNVSLGHAAWTQVIPLRRQALCLLPVFHRNEICLVRSDPPDPLAPSPRAAPRPRGPPAASLTAGFSDACARRGFGLPK